MSDIVVNCPNCRQDYTIDPQTLGRQFKCVQCGQTFTATAPAAMQTPAPPPQAYAPVSAPTSLPQAPTMPPSYLGEAPPGVAPRSSVAVASLICALLCWIWPVSIAALVLGIIGIGKTRNGQMRGGGMAVTGIVLGAIGLILGPIVGVCALVMVPAVRQAKQAANGVISIANLEQIGTAMAAYENQNAGAYPPDLETLVSTQGLSTSLFVYPGGTDKPAPSANTLESGGHLSYVYLGAGKTTLADADRVVLYENGRGHQENSVRGLNILFADGHAEFETKAMADSKISETRDALKLPTTGN